MTSAFAHNSLSTYVVNDELREGFPLAIDDMTLAFHLGIRNKNLWWMLNLRNEGKAYNCFGIPEFRSDGTFKKIRKIQEPMPELKKVHGVLNGIFSSVPLPKCVAAYVRGLKPADAASQHVRPSSWFPQDVGAYEQVLHARHQELLTTGDAEKTAQAFDTWHNFRRASKTFAATQVDLDDDPRYKKIARYETSHDPLSPAGWFYHQPTVVMHLDITNFFNSVRASWIRKFFCDKVGYSHYVSALLATLCTDKIRERDRNGVDVDKRFLPQGSPLSGSLSNLVGYHLFGETIESLLADLSPDWVFTVYSDDIVISHPDQTITNEAVEKVRDTVIKIVEESGFEINKKKTWIQRSKFGRIVILGCVVNEKLNLPKHVYKGIKSLLHNCLEHGWESQIHAVDNRTAEGVVQYARGMKEYVKQVRPDYYEELNHLFEAAIKKFPLSEKLSLVMINKELHDGDRGPQSSGTIPDEQEGADQVGDVRT